MKFFYFITVIGQNILKQNYFFRFCLRRAKLFEVLFRVLGGAGTQIRSRPLKSGPAPLKIRLVAAGFITLIYIEGEDSFCSS